MDAGLLSADSASATTPTCRATVDKRWGSLMLCGTLVHLATIGSCYCEVGLVGLVGVALLVRGTTGFLRACAHLHGKLFLQIRDKVLFMFVGQIFVSIWATWDVVMYCPSIGSVPIFDEHCSRACDGWPAWVDPSQCTDGCHRENGYDLFKCDNLSYGPCKDGGKTVGDYQSQQGAWSDRRSACQSKGGVHPDLFNDRFCIFVPMFLIVWCLALCVKPLDNKQKRKLEASGLGSVV